MLTYLVKSVFLFKKTNNKEKNGPQSVKPGFSPGENILWLIETFVYLFELPGEYYKVTIIIYWIEVLPFVGLKESLIWNFQTI